MIVGLGSDIVEIERIERAYMRLSDKFLRRILGPEEYDLAMRLSGHRLAEFTAGRFAVKEAMAKASGLGLGGIVMSEVSVVLASHGLTVSPGEKSPLAKLPGSWHLSISHSETVAFAVAILERT